MGRMREEKQLKRIGNLVAPATIDHVWAITSDEVMDEDLLFRIVEYPFENRERMRVGTVLGQIEEIFCSKRIYSGIEEVEK
ncbi:MAG: hypothetical protein QXU11_11025 [Thermoproteota archaeon]